MQKIPLMDLTGSFPQIYEETMNKIEYLVKNTQFIGGDEVAAFDKEFAEFCGVPYAIGCSNGTDALVIALKALGIGVGDTVLTVPNSFIATTEAISCVGAEIDFIDIEEQYYTMDPALLRKYMLTTKKNVKAIIPVHLYGQMANMPELMEIAKEYNLKVIEDTAQAHGASIEGKMPGQWGDIATFSFYPGKNLGAFGDAGAVITRNEDLYIHMKKLINHGRWQAKYEHEIEGYNHRIDTIQAAILRIKLRHLSEWNERRRKVADQYEDLLKSLDIIGPKVRSNAQHVFYVYTIRVKNRDEFQRKLKEKGIETQIYYPIPLHLQPAYKSLGYKTGDFPITERISGEILSIPLWPEISEMTIACICNELRALLVN